MCVCMFIHIYTYVCRNIHINLRAECFPEKALRRVSPDMPRPSGGPVPQHA